LQPLKQKRNSILKDIFKKFCLVLPKDYTVGQMGKWASRQMGRRAGRQMGRWADGLVGRWADGPSCFPLLVPAQ
jgi:hypothetical protein